MCGRFTLTVDPAELQDTFSDYTFPNKFAPRFNDGSQPMRRPRKFVEAE